MELIANNNTQEMILNESEVSNQSSSNFIEANTIEVSLGHLENDCIIPVFSKDNESTISHFQFINEVLDTVQDIYDFNILQPDIKVSHVVKGRIPSAIGKPVKELMEHEKTIYYERMAFTIDIPNITKVVNGNLLTLNVGGVRAYNQQNLYSKKTLEKFKLFIGFKNQVCTNLCVSTDGFLDDVRIGSILELREKALMLFDSYNSEEHLIQLQNLNQYNITEKQFAHFIGKARMYQYLSKEELKEVFPMSLNDGQINHVVRDYYTCPNFSRSNNNSLNLWNLYNLFTEANKSSYIDSNLERNVQSFELAIHLVNSVKNDSYSWYLHK